MCVRHIWFKFDTHGLVVCVLLEHTLCARTVTAMAETAQCCIVAALEMPLEGSKSTCAFIIVCVLATQVKLALLREGVEGHPAD